MRIYTHLILKLNILGKYEFYYKSSEAKRLKVDSGPVLVWRCCAAFQLYNFEAAKPLSPEADWAESLKLYFPPLFTQNIDFRENSRKRSRNLVKLSPRPNLDKLSPGPIRTH